MNFFAYYAGVSIDAFTARDARSARRFIDKRYKNSDKIVIAPEDSSKESFEWAKQESIRLAK